MSGVELLGLAASGAGLLSLAIQLGESAMKLREIYHAARDAPRTVSKLAFGIETMALALQELETHRQQTGGGGVLLARCLVECRQSTAEIQELVGKMGRHLEKHSRLGGRAYAVFRERDMKELLDDLEKAKSALQLAYMMFLDQEQRERHSAHLGTLSRQATLLQDLQIQVSKDSTRLSNQLTALTRAPARQEESCVIAVQTQTATVGRPPSAGDGSSSTDTVKSQPRRIQSRAHMLSPREREKARDNTTYYFRTCLRLPAWLSRRVWDLAITSAQCNWNLHLRTYNVISPGSRAVHYCLDGNLAGIRKLMDSREASPLDTISHRAGPNSTLLKYAAWGGHLEVCRYLLDQTVWPDQAEVLSEALSYFTWQQDHHNADLAAGYRLFMNSPGWDPDLDNNSAPRWMSSCRTADTLSTFLLDQFPGYWTLEARFSLAVRMHSIETSGFLRCVGLQPSDPRLALLRDSTGRSALHYIAGALPALWPWDARSQEYVDLFNLGVQLLQNGIATSSICEPQVNLPGRGTPLMCLLDLSTWTKEDSELQWRLRIIQEWARMIQQAGLNLCEYGAREQEIWRTVDNVGNPSAPRLHNWNCIQLHELVYGPAPSDWRFLVRKYVVYGLYELQSPPGSFPMDPRLPRVILWPPTCAEHGEGTWKLNEKMHCVSQDKDARNTLGRMEKEPFPTLMTGVQDDSGVLTLMQYQCSRRSRPAPRSHSQPPCLRPRQTEYQNDRRARSWIPAVHFCPFRSRWGFGCVKGQRSDGSWGIQSASCAKGEFLGSTTVQGFSSWRYGSFLAAIAKCQEGLKHSVYTDLKAHTGTDDCPLGCAKVHLDRLRVPAALRPYHPRRWFDD